MVVRIQARGEKFLAPSSDCTHISMLQCPYHDGVNSVQEQGARRRCKGFVRVYLYIVHLDLAI